MTKQTGLHHIEGPDCEYNIYNSRDGYRVRRKSRVSARRMATNLVYKRSRENYSEFGAVADASLIPDLL